MSLTAGASQNELPTWQPDADVRVCNGCHREFNWWWRKHHCRRCGLVMCSNCSSQTTAYTPTTYVVSKPSQVFLASPVVPHRTCDSCMAELAARRGGRGPSGDYSDILSPTSRTWSLASSANNGLRDDTDSVDSASWCPICGRNMSSLSSSDQERHIESCLIEHEFGTEHPLPLNLATPVTAETEHNLHRSRMLVYTIPKPPPAPSSSSKPTPSSPAGEHESKTGSLDNDDSKLMTLTIPSLGECVICFEDFLPGDRVARMECLCIYHESCIKGWFKKKGERICPVHTE
ncbi:hypothetical protein NADFUDRAFT_50159 [Nadsonia fulvescens var. elongata DSM 6958]|uniref:RING-type E3 ubiquitin transferase n=1 Tax=Nadsonia fulvescens var. elongata DSM 6958 TaxID=857566 RepID=A0A1E3PLN5_9ASCO|nr:hypothetical protein NADFUDRAFT_50159 [Nadsonia fulvescens var. elongata DSM 6958]